MSTVRTFRLDQVVDGAGARVVVQLMPDGRVSDAWFDLGALPRVEGLLRGQPVTDVPAMIAHLCGICPVAHHLAGARALDAFIGAVPITATAELVRRLLHHGAVLQTHARRSMEVDAGRALGLEGFARRVVAATAGPSHFPRCAVPGGVVAAVTHADRESLLREVSLAIQQAADIVAQIEAQERPIPPPTFTGHDMALVDHSGSLDLYGAQLRAVAADSTVVIDGALPEQWPDLVAESRPGATASRPFLRAFGVDRGGYRVGPVAQLRVATHLSTPVAESARQHWAAASGGATWARAVVALHAVEVIADLLARPLVVGDHVVVQAAAVPLAGPLAVPLAVPFPGPLAGSQAGLPRVVTGWVDGARGLLVHTYRVDGDAQLTDATITTPTAQNEQWMAALLGAAARDHAISDGRCAAAPPPGLPAAMEAAVREADPCLPCTSLPAGQMGLKLTMTDAQGNPTARWDLTENPSMDDRRAATNLEPGRG